MKGSLYVMRGPDAGRRFEFAAPVIGIGRDPTNHIQLRDAEVSRQHARISRDAHGVHLQDLGSSNGTYVDGHRVHRATLQTGSRVQIGQTIFLYTESAQPRLHESAQEINITGEDIDMSPARIVSAMGAQHSTAPLSDESSDLSSQIKHHLSVMYRLTVATSHTLDIKELLDRILALILDTVKADRGVILLNQGNPTQFVHRVVRSRHPLRKGQSINISRSILGYVLQQGEGVLTTNARDDDRWDTAESVLKMGIQEAICVPMQGRYGVVGVIYIDAMARSHQLTNPRLSRFNNDHLQLMVAIAHQAALAIEDTTFYSAMVQSERLAAVGQTIAVVSHHVKNLMQGIRGGGYLIQEGLRGSDMEAIQQGWAMVEKNQERISNLMMDLLNYSKDRQPDFALASLNKTVGEVIEVARTTAEEQGVELEWAANPGLVPFVFDPEAIHRAVLNVVLNAIDACTDRPAGCVRVSISQPTPEEVMITVADNGVGIKPEDRETIFQLFVSHKGKKGTGIGLPVSRKIMREHGGDIRVQSKPGHGSRFTLVLPFRQMEAHRLQTVTQAHLQDPPSGVQAQ